MAAALALGATPLAGQLPLTIAGQTLRILGQDTLQVPGVAITLHRVGRTVQGAIDSATAGSDGRFRFRLTGDTTAVYLVSAQYAGIEYFSEPVRPPGAMGVRIIVSDTSSMAPVRLAARHVIIRPPDASGTRAVLDLLSIRNDGPDTRIGRDSLSPSWQVLLPAGATQVEVQEGDVSPTAINVRGDTLLVLAPLAPGSKSVMVSYLLPVGLDRPTWIAPVDSFDLLVEEARATVRGAGLASVAPVELMGSSLRRWTAAPPTGGVAEVRFAGGAATFSRILYGLVGVVAILLLAGAAWTFRRTRAPKMPSSAPLPADLVGALAALDARYAGRREQVPADEWSSYESDRARLKAAALARGRFHP